MNQTSITFDRPDIPGMLISFDIGDWELVFGVAQTLWLLDVLGRVQAGVAPLHDTCTVGGGTVTLSVTLEDKTPLRLEVLQDGLPTGSHALLPLCRVGEIIGILSLALMDG